MRLPILAVFIVSLLFMLVPVNAQVFNGPNSLTVVSQDLNVTFDKLHGGVVSSLKFAGREFLTGGGAWGTIDMVRSYYSSGDICTLWPIDMQYQYDDPFANITYSQTDSDYVVTVYSGTDTITWYISKDHNVIRADVKPGLATGKFLYIPLRKGMSTLTFYTLDGPVYAEPTEYCVAPSYEAPLVQYFDSGDTLMLFSQNPMAVSYYGYDTGSWQVHYPTPNPKEILFLFYMVPQ